MKNDNPAGDIRFLSNMPRLFKMLRVVLRSLIKSILRIRKPAPLFCPPGLFSQYLMGGKVRLRYWYEDGTRRPDDPIVFTPQRTDYYLSKIENKERFYYGATDSYLYQALDKYGIRGKSVVVIGSVTPWYESICLFYKGIPTTVDYNRIINSDPRIRFLTTEEYARDPLMFEAAFSISSFEHDGLGRYGEKLDPLGDLKAMEKTRLMIKPGGLLFLSVPVGKDTLIWNSRRIYGKLRLPLLLEGWKILDRFGFEESMLDLPLAAAEPVFVLENPDSHDR